MQLITSFNTFMINILVYRQRQIMEDEHSFAMPPQPQIPAAQHANHKNGSASSTNKKPAKKKPQQSNGYVCVNISCFLHFVFVRQIDRTLICISYFTNDMCTVE
jgi:hypothetical protein